MPLLSKCAVVDCGNPGRPQVCPYDGRFHHHGRIHYDCGYPAHSLTFEQGEWLYVCNEHYAILKREREEWEATTGMDQDALGRLIAG
jgi:hypothetical protein